MHSSFEFDTKLRDSVICSIPDEIVVQYREIEWFPKATSTDFYTWNLLTIRTRGRRTGNGVRPPTIPRCIPMTALLLIS